MNIGDIIESRRRDKRLSQKALGDAAGLSQTFVSDLENNRRQLTQEVKDALELVIGPLPDIGESDKRRIRVRTEGDKVPKTVTPSNVGRLYIDAPSNFDVIQPVLRQRIHAGTSMPIVEETADFYNVTKAYRNTVTVEVVGDSMKDAGIAEGDRVVIKTDKQPQNGDTVLVSLNGEFLLKGYEKDSDGNVHLWPANDKYEPVYVQASDDYNCEGVMVELIRKSDRSWLANRKRSHKGKG